MNWTSVTNYSLQFNMRVPARLQIMFLIQAGNVVMFLKFLILQPLINIFLSLSVALMCSASNGLVHATCWCSTELGVSEFKFSYTYWNKDANLLVHQHLDDFYLQYVLYGKCKFHFSMTEVTQVMHTKLTFSLS